MNINLRLEGVDTFRLLFIIFLFSLFIRLLFFDTSYFIWDETVYMMQGKHISGTQVGYEEAHVRPPLLPIFLSLIWNLAPSSYEILSRLLIIFLNSLIIIPVYYTGRVFNRQTAMLSCVVIAILPISILNSRYVMTDHLGAMLALSSFLLFFVGLKYDKKTYWYIGSLLLAVSILTKFTNILLLAVLAPTAIILLKNKPKQATYCLLIFLLTLFPFLLYNYIKYSSPFAIFANAWKVVNQTEPIEALFFLYLFNDAFGVILIAFALFGIFIFVADNILYDKSHERHLNILFLYSFFVILIYFVYIVHKGVAKPAGIEWEVQRFMLLLVPFIVVFACYSLIRILNLMQQKKNWQVLILSLFLSNFLFLAPYYFRAYEPQIKFEDGLRLVTLRMADYIKTANLNQTGCIGNCPPVAYYSNKKIEIFYDESQLLNSSLDNLVSFKLLKSSRLINIRTFCDKNSCAYLYRKAG